jgi:Flp pilus assembly protein TadB
VLLVMAAVQGRRVLSSTSGRRLADGADRFLLRAALALVGAVLGFVCTRWPVVGLLGAVCGWFLPTVRASRGRANRDIDKVEAIATWTEQLRDTLGGASGLQSALIATAPLAPQVLAPAAGRLAARLEYERTAPSLRAFAHDVDHPIADFVVAALVIATEHEARDLSRLLGELATSAREEARLRTRVWVGRARTRTSVRIIAAIVPLMIGAVMIVDRSYLRPYDSAAGQAALLGVLVVFAIALIALERMGRIRLPERFVARSTEGERA